jgi:hypothetical protein
MMGRRMLMFFGLLLCLVGLTQRPARAALWVSSGTDPGYTAIGGTHGVTLAAPSPDDPALSAEWEKSGPYYDWSWSPPANLTVSPSSPQNGAGGSMLISGTSNTAAAYSLPVTATGYRLKRLKNGGGEWTRYADRTDSYTLTFNFVTVTVAAWNDVTADWETGANAAEIASGAIDSDAHKTQVQLTAAVAHPVEVKVTLTGGSGHAGSNNAKLDIGNTTITAGNYGYVTTAANGTLTGWLTSSNLLNNTTVTGGGGSASVTFAWDNYDEDDAWAFDQGYIMAGMDVNFTFYMALNYAPIDGHTILFVVEKVYYTDQSGVATETDSNTPGHPCDLGGWADFTEPSDPTDSNGEVSATVHLKSNSLGTATWITIRAYDMTIFTQ